MNAPTARVVLRMVFVILLVTLGFTLLQGPVRLLEMRAATGTLTVFGAGPHLRLADAAALVIPTSQPFFVAVLTPACSSLAAVLAILSLGVLLPRAGGLRRATAILAAIVTVVVGNLVRIVASLAVGLVAGRSSLILFHDVAGSAFTFAYVLGGYILMLSLLLPRPVPVGVPARTVQARAS